MMALLNTLLRWFGLAMVGAAAILALAVALVAIVAPRIDLSTMRPRIEAIAEQALGRSIRLQGPLAVILSLPPTIEAAQIHIANPPDWSSPEFAWIEEISARVSLTPLLRSEIVINEIHASGIGLSLEATPDGRNNWTFAAGEQEADGDNWKLAAINDLSLSDLVLRYKDHPQQPEVAFELRIERLTGQLPADDPIQIKMAGKAQDFPFSIQATAGSLDELLSVDATVPFNVTAEVNNNQLQVDGSVTGPLKIQGVDATFQLNGAHVANLAEILDASLPVIGGYRVDGELSGNLNELTISDIDGHLGNTEYSGDLRLVMGDERTRIEGSLIAKTLDLGPWLTTEETTSQNGPVEESDVLSGAIPDIDLHLEVDKFLDLPVAVEDVSLTLKLRGNSLIAPFQFKFDNVVIRGDIGIENKNGEHRVTAAFHSQHVDIGSVVERYTDLKGIAGKVGAFSIVATSHGTELRSFIETLAVNILVRDAAMTYGNEPGEMPVSIDFDEMTFHGRSRQRAGLTINGRLLGEPFAAELTLGDLPTLLGERNLPFDLRAAGAGAELAMSGQLAGKNSPEDTALKVQLSGKRLGDLSLWLGVSPAVEAQYSLAGQLIVQNDQDAWQLHNLHLQLGRSSIDGTIGLSRLDSRPLLTTTLAFDAIDPYELERIFATEQPLEEHKDSEGIDVEMPILPVDLKLKDMDIDIKGERIVLEPFDVTDIAFSSRLRDGHVSNAPFLGTLADVHFTGNLAMDLRGNVPEIGLDLEALDVDVGNFLRELELATEIDAHAERLTAKLESRGRSINELFNDTELNIEVHSGHWFLTDPNKAGSASIAVRHGTAKATTRTKQTVVKLDARIGEVPMEFTLETKRLPQTSDGRQFLDTRIKAIAAGAELTMQGVLPRLTGLRGLDMHISFRGDRIDSLDELLNVSLPPFGPYSVDGDLKIGDTEYILSNLEIRVGDTIAAAGLKVSTAGTKPRFNWMLEAKTLQVDDFKLDDWAPVADTNKDNEEIDTEIEASESEKIPTDQDNENQTHVETARALLSPDVMNKFDGEANIQVGEVLSGPDRVGSGVMSIELQNGKLSLSLNIDLPGGEVGLELSLQVNEHDRAATLRSKIENFDYGVFARRINPNTDMAGKFSVDVDLSSRSKTLRLIDDNANGYFDFVIWPETLRSGIFDLWTANLFFAVLPVLNLQTQSKVNCIVGQLDMDDGIMKLKTLFMDTTRTQVKGKGEINFRTERIKLRLKPRSKRPRFFSLSTPVVVEGDFSDFGVGLRPHDLLGTAIRMVGTLILVPGQYISQGVRPGVDTEECERAIDARSNVK